MAADWVHCGAPAVFFSAFVSWCFLLAHLGFDVLWSLKTSKGDAEILRNYARMDEDETYGPLKIFCRCSNLW